jgi:hypothetical protein
MKHIPGDAGTVWHSSYTQNAYTDWFKSLPACTDLSRDI